MTKTPIGKGDIVIQNTQEGKVIEVKNDYVVKVKWPTREAYEYVFDLKKKEK